MTGQKFIKLTISDELAGIASYKGMLTANGSLWNMNAKTIAGLYSR